MGKAAAGTTLSDQRDDSKTLEVLYDISHAVSVTRNLDELYVRIHKALDSILRVENFYIALHHEERDSITFPYYVDEKDNMPAEIFNFSETASLTGIVINARQPKIFYEQDIIDFARQQNQEIIGTVSKIWLGTPLIIRDRVIGAIAIQSFDSADAYVAADLDLLNIVSQHIALAIERKEAENKVQDQQQVLETILESSPVGICLVENREFTWVNSRMVQMLGYEDKADLTHQSCAIIYASDEEYQEAGNKIREGLDAKGKADFDIFLVRKDGVKFKAHMIISESGKVGLPRQTIATVADLSRLEQAHQERIEKEKLQGVLEMAGAICHEINQPLQTIIGYTSLFESPEAISPKALKEIRSQARRIGTITERLAKITRYKTISYPGDTTIVDIWESSN